MIKAFTFAELMISLVIISVITALLYPTISELAPNNNKHLFKTTYKTISLVVDEIINGQNETGAGNACTGQAVDTAGAISDPHNLCCQFNNRLSTATMYNNANPPVEITNCSTGAGVNTLLQTSNGVRWWFDDSGSLYVDVNASNNNIASQCNATNAVWVQGAFCNNDAIRDTFHITLANTGKITIADAHGERHIRNETDD